MPLRIIEQAGLSDVGRQRSANEDSLVVQPPFYAVADGMGGARAGEVASAIAAKAFEGELDADEPAEKQLTRIVREANRRIYEIAVSDESRRGMGTTLTAAKLHDGEISLGHVGDSRAYLLRDGELEQLTRDHSLVAELERSGQITPEAAEHHPQRSIITRALGPEPDVEVDTYTVSGRPDDVFLICSDGLTSMISDEEVAAILRTSGSLEDTAEALVRAANQSGGKDNITVILFRLGEVEREGPDDATLIPSEDDTIAGQVTAAEVAAAGAAVTTERARQIPPEAPRAGRDSRPAPAARRRRRRGGRLVLKIGLALVLVAAAVAGLYALSRQVYFIGTNDAGLVTIYRGVPYELPFGINLYDEDYASSMPARAIPDSRRGRVLDHEWRGRADAEDLVRALERGQLDAGASG